MSVIFQDEKDFIIRFPDDTNSDIESKYASRLVGLFQNEGGHHCLLPGWSNFCQPCKFITVNLFFILEFNPKCLSEQISN